MDTMAASHISNRGALLAARNLILPRKETGEFCRRNHVRKLALFGSVLRDDFSPQSDVEVVVEYERGHVPGLAFITHQEELSSILGRNVDLNTPRFISRYFRQEVLRDAKVVYGEA